MSERSSTSGPPTLPSNPAVAAVSVPTAEQAAAACLAGRVNRRQAFVKIAEAGSAQAALAETNSRERSGRCATPEELQELCERHALGLVTYFDAHFPQALRHIPDPPLVLCVRGNMACLAEPCVAVVGARRCSRMAMEFASELAADLLRGGLTVVSGLARGIDAAAHRGALAAVVAGSGANTVAVMGAGLASIYPRSNTQLARALTEAGGLLVSEYLPTVPPAKHQFPERNRLISGLSQGVVIVEAGERSGSLITARLALEQGREVMAVPGAVAAGLSRGCHRLLREGAALVECAADVFSTLGYVLGPELDAEPEPAAVATELGSVLAAVEPAVTTLDELVAATGLTPAVLTAKLLELELAGFVHQVAEGYIRRPFSRG